MSESTPNASREFDIVDELVLSDSQVVPVLFHAKRQKILRQLIEGEWKIIDLKQKLGMNPGTIKRHLDALRAVGLVAEPRIITNEYGIKEKYYHATARHFRIELEWPEE